MPFSRAMRRSLVSRRAPILIAIVSSVVLSGAESAFDAAAAAGTETTRPEPAGAPKEPDAPAPLPPMEGDIGHPYYLPQTSRARMHECALAWQRIKLAGGAESLTWRVFATRCFTAPDVKSVATPDAPAPSVQK